MENAVEKVFKKGKKYFFRGLTYHLIGTVKAVEGTFVVLDKATFVINSGRFNTALETGKLEDAEYVGDAIMNTQNLVDAFPWKHKE